MEQNANNTILDRRRAGDTRFSLQVTALVEQATRGRGPNPGLVRNLSRGGALLCLSQAAIPGAPVRVTLKLRRGTQLSLMGTVAWTRSMPGSLGWELGVHFSEELPAELVAEIAREDSAP